MAGNPAHYGLGSGTPAEELERWLKEAGRVTVHSEGLQNHLFETQPVEMFRLFNKKGDSILVSAETAARYGLQPGRTQRPRNPESTPDLFNPQGGLF